VAASGVTARQVLAKARTKLSTQVMYTGRHDGQAGRQRVGRGCTRLMFYCVLCAVHLTDGLEVDSNTK
jgi:hypothetical protein